LHNATLSKLYATALKNLFLIKGFIQKQLILLHIAIECLFYVKNEKIENLSNFKELENFSASGINIDTLKHRGHRV